MTRSELQEWIDRLRRDGISLHYLTWETIKDDPKYRKVIEHGHED